MVPDQDEYGKFGRSTKLLIHPKDIPDLQLLEKSRNNSEIPPDTEISIIEEEYTSERGGTGEILPDQQVLQELVIGSGLPRSKGEMSPKVQKQTREQITNPSKQYIAGTSEEGMTPRIVSSSQLDNELTNRKWLYNPINCVSKWSKALKQGIANSVGLDLVHTASIPAMKKGNPKFSFFL